MMPSPAANAIGGLLERMGGAILTGSVDDYQQTFRGICERFPASDIPTSRGDVREFQLCSPKDSGAGAFAFPAQKTISDTISPARPMRDAGIPDAPV